MQLTIEIEVQDCENLTLEIIDAPVSDSVSIDDSAGIGDTDVTWSADKSARELADKVDKEVGMGLSELSFTTVDKLSLDQSEQDRHTHNNKPVIDGLSDDAGVLQYKGLPISDQAALDAKVDKVAGYSLVDDAEIAKLATVQENATANRADSENADKIHEHVIADVDGLDEALLTKFDKADIAQATGTATDKVMSQKAVTDALLAIQDVVEIARVTWDMDNDVYSGAPRATLAHKSMRRCLVKSDGTVNYYLNEYDSTKKANGVDAADLSGASGQVMVEISPVYVRTSFKDRIVTWELTHAALPGFVLHPAFEGGVEKTYIGAYNATVFSAAADAVIDGLNSDNNSARIDLATDKLYSASGNYCMVGVHRADFRTLAENHGFQLYDYWQWQLVQYLFITEYGNWNSQAVLGNGNVSRNYPPSSDVQADSPHTVNGLSNNFGNYSGAVAQGSGEPFVTYRGIENAWGQVNQWVDGVNILERQLWVSNDETAFNDNNKTGYIELGVPMPENGYIKNWQTLENSFVPAVTGEGAGASTFIGDYLYTAAGRRGLLVGGGASIGVSAGLSFAYGNYSALNHYRIVSARLSKKLRS